MAASCAACPADLLILGVLTVKVAFRVGACAWDMGSRLTPCRDATGQYRSWTAAFAGVEKNDVIDIIEQYVTSKVSDETHCMRLEKGKGKGKADQSMS